MPTTVTLDVPTWTQRTVTLPDACPKCGADLAKPGALHERNMRDEWSTTNADGVGDLAASHYDYAGDERRTLGLECRACHHSLTEGFEPLNPDAAGLAPDLLRGLKAMAEIAESDLERGEPERYDPEKLRDLQRAFAWLSLNVAMFASLATDADGQPDYENEDAPEVDGKPFRDAFCSECGHRFGEDAPPVQPGDLVRPFRVDWRIDLEAADHRDAARQAWTIMQRPGSTANVFDVTDPDGRPERVDLSDGVP